MIAFSVEFSLQAGNDQGPIIAHTSAEVAAAFARILAAAPLLHNPTAHVRERPRFGPAQIPDHGLKMDVSPQFGVGALAYFGDPENEQSGPWVTKSGAQTTSAPLLHRDIDSATPFPVDAAISLDLIRQALHEFHSSGGRRPPSVAWQASASW